MKSKVAFTVDSEALKAIVEARMPFPSNLFVSVKSRFGDSVWSWEEPQNLRLNTYSKGDLVIDWALLSSTLKLPINFILDLKKYAFLRFSYSVVVFPETKKNIHPANVCEEVKVLSSFLSYLCGEISVSGTSLINWLTDIEVEDLRYCLASYNFNVDGMLKRVLINLGSEMFSRNLGGRIIKWNKFDIFTLPWRKSQKKVSERIPTELFSFLSNSASADVKQFLKALEIKTDDKTLAGDGENRYLQAFNDFRNFFEEYLQYRHDNRSGKETVVKRQCRIKGRKIGDLNKISKLIDRARVAAQIIIMLYTGARISELSAFKLDCLRQKDDQWVLIGTVIKHVDIHAPIDQDEWVAIPIVCDAVRVLQQTARITCAKYLFHRGNLASGARDSLSKDAISASVRLYVQVIDVAKKWKNVRLQPNQFRNNLVFEMRKAELGLPFITHQLKHATNTFEKYSTSKTTLLYGSLENNAVHNAIMDANLIALREIYHPDAPIAGGGAEQHKKRREAYFLGMAHQGTGVDDALRHLALQGGMPLTDVGLGYCQGQLKIMVDGVKTEPPCIGELRCNPVRCQNAIIPLHKLSVWEKIAQDNRIRAADPEFTHARSYLLEAAEEADSVIKLIQIERENK